MPTLPELLKTTVEVGGSDLHLTTDSPPQVRVHGELRRLQMPNLTPADTKQLVYSVLTDSQKKRFEELFELDFSFGIRGLARFRCNVFNQRGAVGAGQQRLANNPFEHERQLRADLRLLTRREDVDDPVDRLCRRVRM